MKIAEDWAKIGHILTSDIKQIQLDAMKEGMRRAAYINKQVGPHIVMTDSHAICENRRLTILTAAEQLTEKDLC